MLGATWFELAPLLAELSHERRDLTAPGRWPGPRAGYVRGIPVVIAAGGIGKTNTAAAIATVHAVARLGAVLQVGIGGAYPAADGTGGLSLGTVAVAASEYDLDLGVGTAGQWQGLEAIGFAAVATEPPTYNLIACDAQRSRRVATATGSRLLPFATSDSVTADPQTARLIVARCGAAIESMEGAAAAQACLALGLPFVEVRAVSNAVGSRDKSTWRVGEASAAAAAAALTALPTLQAV